MRRLDGREGRSGSGSGAGEGGRLSAGWEAAKGSGDADRASSSEGWASSSSSEASESGTCAAARLFAAPDMRRAGAAAVLAPDALRLVAVGVDVLAAPVLVRGRWGLKGFVFGAVREGGMVGCVRVCCLVVRRF